MENCLGDQAILLVGLESEVRCAFLENVLKLNSKFSANPKALAQEKAVTFFLEHTWLIFANPVVSAREKEIFWQICKMYEVILKECVR